MEELPELRAAIVAAVPELSGAAFTLLPGGWDCVAVDVDDRLVFKFPRHRAAEERLIAEASLLAIVRPAVTLRVPDLSLHRRTCLFSQHTKLPGEHLITAQYERLPAEARRRLAAELALFYTELHRLDIGTMDAAGAGPVAPWLPPEEILRRTWPVLPPDLRSYAERTITEWQSLAPDPYGIIYGFFDGHGWNMAFDHTRNRLNGIYDFGDSGLGPLHQELIYSSWISQDLTARIISEYEILSGRMLDRARIDLLSGILRLSELAEYANDPGHAPAMIQNVADWAGSSRG